MGSAAGISVIGWEPDRELDHIKSTWSSLDDMKVVKNKLVSEKLSYIGFIYVYTMVLSCRFVAAMKSILFQ